MPIKNPHTTKTDVMNFLIAAYLGHLDTVTKMILDGTVDVNDCLDDESFQDIPAGTTALMAAVFRVQKPIVDFLLGNYYEFSHRYVARDADGHVSNITFYENYTRNKLALNGITLDNVNVNGDNAFSLALKSQGERKDRDDIAAALLDAEGKIAFQTISQDVRSPEDINNFFYPFVEQSEILSSLSDDGVLDTDDDELSDSDLSDVMVTFTEGNLLAALTQQVQRKFAKTNTDDPLVLATEQKLPQTAARLLKLGLPYSAAAGLAKGDSFNFINTYFQKRVVVQEPMDHATRENRPIIQQISYRIGTRDEIGDELYKSNLDKYYKALHYVDLDEQDNLFHLMQILMQRNDLSTPDRNGRRLKIPTADFPLVRRVILELMKPVMFARKFDGGSLMFAAVNADEQTIILLANMGVPVLDPNASDTTPIRFMADRGNIGAVRALWRRGALLNDISTVVDFENKRFVFFYNEPTTAIKTPFYGTALQFAALTKDAQFVEALLDANLVSLRAGKEQVQQITNILRKAEFADMRESLASEGMPVQVRNTFSMFSFRSCFTVPNTAAPQKRDNPSPVVLTDRSATATPNDIENAALRTTPTIEISSPSRKKIGA